MRLRRGIRRGLVVEDKKTKRGVTKRDENDGRENEILPHFIFLSGTLLSSISKCSAAELMQ